MTSPPNNPSSAVVRCDADEGFSAWLAEVEGALAVTTYQAGKLALVAHDGRQVTLLMRQFDKPMGLAHRGKRMALACRRDIHLLSDDPLLAHEYLEGQPGRYDALYLPRVSYHVGELNVHDVQFGDAGLWLVVTRFSCLGHLSDEFSFTPAWKPPFVTELAPEDRCHLNGLAMRDGKPAYVTALGTTDTAGGWRENKRDGGVVLDVDSGEVVLRGLSMPHSPRWRDGRLWALNSGAGELGTVDTDSGSFAPVCALPGYLRGLCFIGDHAVVGLSQIREKHIFGGLPVQERFEELLCAVAVVDLRTGRHVGSLTFTSGCQELYDVAFLPGPRRPNVLNLEKDAVRQAISAPDFSYWLRESAEVR